MAAGLVLIGGSLGGCAAPPPPVPVCAQPDVLRQVYETIRKQGQKLVLEAPPVGEVSIAANLDGAKSRSPDDALDRPPLAQCAVRGHTIGYDTNRYGASPVHESFTVRYTVELRRNGVFVKVD
ncbi:MAG: hypothetical protein EOO66_12145 [Methylobacterium sp.]|nr:MAG: hypothetical protein EOO66_12145 [Methylobacterium sp.]